MGDQFEVNWASAWEKSRLTRVVSVLGLRVSVCENVCLHCQASGSSSSSTSSGDGSDDDAEAKAEGDDEGKAESQDAEADEDKDGAQEQA